MEDRVRTGIPGFDELIKGGLPRSSVLLLSGGPGVGKSLFSLQFLINGALTYNEPGLLITFEESEKDLKLHATHFGWDLDKLLEQDLLRIQFLEAFRIEGFIEELPTIIDETKIKRIVIDSTSVIASYLKDEYQVRQTLYKLIRTLKATKQTCILTSEFAGGDMYSYSVQEYVVDGLIRMYHLRQGNKRIRALEVLKMRNSDHDNELRPFRIAEKGIEIFNSMRVYE